MQEVQGRPSQGFGGESEGGKGQELKEKLGETAHRATEQARSVAERGKQKLAESAQGVTSALRHASDGLREDEQQELARYTRVVADKLDQLTSTLRERDVPALLAEVSRFAKSQPALFLGGAFTTGLIAARFLKSSAPQSRGGTRTPGSAFAPQSGSSQGFAGASGYAGPAMGETRDDATLRDDVTAPSGFGPAPGGYGPASAPAGAHGGAGIFGTEGAGGGPGNDPDGEKGAP